MRSEEEKEIEILRGLEREEKVREEGRRGGKGRGREGGREGSGGSGHAFTNQANIHLITTATGPVYLGLLSTM